MEFPKSYEPGSFESELFANWHARGLFARDAAGFADDGAKPFTIVIPPPNVTGVLHMGHALNNTLQDVLVRRARMQGRPTRWIVGTDHAGIATQNKVEQKLASEGKTRFDLGREAFVEACWEWRRSYGSTIIEQLKAMGCSCDYDNEKFTMDPSYADAIRRVFYEWYNNELIYRGHRIINWCPRCTTALADDEVEHVDEQGALWYLRYPLVEPVGSVTHVVVATTRPETMLGDTAVVVNPHDERYAALLAAGAQVRLPLVDRVVPLVADEHVDASFGTGAVKVTPAHDPNDFEIGQRHKLEQLNVFDEHAVVNEAGGRFVGMTREEARVAVVEAFDDLGLLDHVEDHDHAVGHCYRCNTTVEPWLSEQWFVSMRELAEPAIAAVREKRVRFFPERWEDVYFHWMENIRDWCVSRQLWWGHRIPVFYCDDCDWRAALLDDEHECPSCGGKLRQDEDVLDTWFSSQLWPFATFGWGGPDPLLDMSEYEAVCHELMSYYPTQVLSTARDIIFLWVARMIMSSLYCTDKVPFPDVLIHPTVLDKHGNIMSKSRGNGIDPLELIEEFGADGMRFGLALQVTGSQDMKFDKDKLVSSRNFSTKLWNAARFTLMNLDGFDLEAARVPGEDRVAPDPHTDADRWILSRLARLSAEIEHELEDYVFGAAARALYSFFWNEFCDWYIEFAKSQLAQGGAVRAATQRTLVFVLDTSLRLLHPFMPFITERIWSSLPHGSSRPSLMVARYPDAHELSAYADEAAEVVVGQICAVVTAVRGVRARYQISPRNTLPVIVRTLGASAAELASDLGRQAPLVAQLAMTAEFVVSCDAEKPAHSSVIVLPDLEVYVPLEGVVDIDKERGRLAAAREKSQAELDKLSRKLANEGFLAKAAPEVVAKTREEADGHARTIEQIDQQLKELC